MAGSQPTQATAPPTTPGLKKIAPYWYPYTTYAKERWLGRELLEVVSTEFRDRSMEYYRYALESGVTTINSKVASPTTIVKNGDRIENVVHRHEPPVTSTPVRVLLHDKERDFIVVDKPGSIPVHASGRYYRNTLIEILVNDFGFEKVYPVNRLDRLTSGLMILPTSAERARTVSAEFMAGTVRKVYVARAKGRFPSGEIVCEEPLMTVDRQMGLNIVHPEGKPAKTVFNLIRYDQNTDSSVVRCEPFTGRSHQIRVHLQYLGHPIPNDPVYSETKIWGGNLGKGGIDIVASDERSAPAPPEHLQSLVQDGNPETRNTQHGDASAKLLPRETGADIGMGSPVPLSSEAVGVITRLRNMKDEDEDWSRWRDVVFRVKGALRPPSLKLRPPPPKNKKTRNAGVFVDDTLNRLQGTSSSPSSTSSTPLPTPAAELITSESSGQLSLTEALSRAAILAEAAAPIAEQVMEQAADENGHMYCPECYLPLHPDPKPERLYIFLHALKYTTTLGSFETEMPEWSKEGWEWDRS